MSKQMQIIGGVDIGGTFTDVFCIDEKTGDFTVAKVPSNRSHPAKSLSAGLTAATGDLGHLSAVVHGTTVGTNALLERRGARAGMIVTAGFRDVLELRRRDRRTTWRLWGDYEPIISRDLIVEIDERTLADGTIRKHVESDDVMRAAARLLELGAESVCIVFINCYANDANEKAALEVLRSVWPNDYVSASSGILREIREFERASTTALNCYLQPVVGRYIGELRQDLASGGFDGTIQIVQSNGGTMSTENACRLPVRTALSGPAAGVIAAAAIAEAAGFENVITCDMGGTSFDVSLIASGGRRMSSQTVIDFGLAIRTPMIEILTISAGGGSLASVDRSGLLQIGPESAGAMPGPVCYGQGNTRPTVTDANLLLGRINSERPIGGMKRTLDREAARAAIAETIGRPLGLGDMQAAEAVIRVANARMAGALRVVSVERGYDPRKFALMPFGGGGPLHAGALMADVGIRTALVPRYPGVTSALGCVLADVRHDVVHTLNLPLANLDTQRLRAEMDSAAKQGLELLSSSGVPMTGRNIRFEIEASYVGQTHTVMVPIPVTYCEKEGVDALSEQMVRGAFERSYAESFRGTLEGFQILLLSLRTTAIGKRPRLDLACLKPTATGPVEQALIDEREVWFDGALQRTRIYDRERLSVGARIAGPAIIEQPDTTILIDPGLAGRVDPLGNIIVTIER